MKKPRNFNGGTGPGFGSGSGLPQPESISVTHTHSQSLSESHQPQLDSLRNAPPLEHQTTTAAREIHADEVQELEQGEEVYEDAEGDEYEEYEGEEDYEGVGFDHEGLKDEITDELMLESAILGQRQSTSALNRQKLADGFYEVETIRKKRIFKGEPQYFIKWRGWPESANTWEPVDHLQTCPDVIEAFEESLRSGQNKNSRKRKRKFTQPKKKMQYSYGASKSKISPNKMARRGGPHVSIALDKHLDVQSSMVKVVVEHDKGTKTSSGAKIVDCNGSETVSLHLDSNDKNYGELSSPQDASKSNLDVHLQQHVPVEIDGPTGCLPKAEGIETGQDVQRRGAKRRKSGSVRRFTQEMTSLNLDFAGNNVPVNINTYDKVGQVMPCNSDSYHRKKLDTTRNSAIITKLIKPISYSASVTNNIQDVSVTFVAMRSDGKEVMVDNKFLKANNPHLLINFYEQHLRYNPN